MIDDSAKPRPKTAIEGAASCNSSKNFRKQNWKDVWKETSAKKESENKKRVDETTKRTEVVLAKKAELEEYSKMRFSLMARKGEIRKKFRAQKSMDRVFGMAVCNLTVQWLRIIYLFRFMHAVQRVSENTMKQRIKEFVRRLNARRIQRAARRTLLIQTGKFGKTWICLWYFSS